jgi:hypothetical protein
MPSKITAFQKALVYVLLLLFYILHKNTHMLGP